MAVPERANTVAESVPISSALFSPPMASMEIIVHPVKDMKASIDDLITIVGAFGLGWLQFFRGQHIVLVVMKVDLRSRLWRLDGIFGVLLGRIRIRKSKEGKCQSECSFIQRGEATGPTIT